MESDINNEIIAHQYVWSFSMAQMDWKGKPHMGNILESPITTAQGGSTSWLFKHLHSKNMWSQRLKSCRYMQYLSKESETVINGTTDYTLRHRLNLFIHL